MTTTWRTPDSSLRARGECLKQVEGSEGKPYMSCHGEAETSTKDGGAAMLKWTTSSKLLVNLEQHINNCCSEHMKAEP